MLFWLCILLLLVCSVFLWKRLNYWKDRGITTPKDQWQETLNILTLKSSAAGRWKEIYQEFKSKGLKHGGTTFFFNPIYVPIDLDIVKSIMQVDFGNFTDKGLYVNEKGDPLTAHLFSLGGSKWKNLRHKITPTFTSGKMKMMFETLVECTEGLQSIIDNSSKTAVDIKEVSARFTTDIIGSCAFGLEFNALKDSDSEFRKNGKAFFETNVLKNLKSLLLNIAPDLMMKLNVKGMDPDLSSFFIDVVRKTINYREKNNVYRKDFMHLLIQLKNRGMVTDDQHLFGDKDNVPSSEKTLTLEEIAAQAFIFFIAGFETSSTTMTFCLYELAKNKEIQEKVRKEIRTVLSKHDYKLTYDAVMSMHYLEQTIYEALRKYPPLPLMFRKCTQDYQVPGTDLILKKGVKVFVPVIGIQHDPEYYPDPEVFDPDRFSEENKKTRPAFSFLSFGEGPRICVGLRFGMMQTKVGLISLLANYEISVSEKTKEPIEFDTTSFIMSTKDGMWLDFKNIPQNKIDLRTGKSA